MATAERYSRQVLFEGIGDAGQARLAASRVAIVGCGALGGIQAETLARAGVGRLILIDRDFVEETNLQRQIMFEERDAVERLPKAVAAARRIARINSTVSAEHLVTDVSFSNVEEVFAGVDLVLDGTDNFETRFLLNDASAKTGVPWIYGAVVSSYGLTMTVLPGKTPCLRCIFETLPEPGSGPTCDTAGVILPAVSVIGSIQTSEALKLLVGRHDQLHGSLIRVDLWEFEVRRTDLSNVDRSECRTCSRRDFDYLRGSGRQAAATLCGRNAVQISRLGSAGLDLKLLAERLRPLGEVQFNDFLLRFRVEGFDITVFPDARSIVRGTTDPIIARGLYARYIGG